MNRPGIRRGVATAFAVLAAATITATGTTPAAGQPTPGLGPTGGVVVGGSAAISQTTTTTTVSQTSARAVINWQSFSIGSQHSVVVAQPSTSSVTLMRTTGADASGIAGKLRSNGTVVLVNPHGTLIYAGGQINAQGLVISTADTTNHSFMSGASAFTLPGGPTAKVSDRGDVTTKAGGDLVLFGPAVSMSGVATAHAGHVRLVAGKTMTITQFGDSQESLSVTSSDTVVPMGSTALVTVSGTVNDAAGVIGVSAAATDGLLQNLISVSGKLLAPTVSGHRGHINVAANGGGAQISGLVAATGIASGAPGGVVCAVSSTTLTLFKSGQVSTNGTGGGGTVGFGIVGTTVTRLAKACPGTRLVTPHVSIGTTGVIHANATVKGDGGIIVAAASKSMVQGGLLTAKGGPNGGNGGNITISSGGSLSHAGATNVSAPNGTAGHVHIN